MCGGCIDFGRMSFVRTRIGGIRPMTELHVEKAPKSARITWFTGGLDRPHLLRCFGHGSLPLREFGFPFGDGLFFASRLVQLHQPLHGLDQADFSSSWDFGLAVFHPLITRDQQRLGLLEFLLDRKSVV